MGKTVLLSSIIVYLFLASMLISMSYVEVDDYWQPSFLTTLPVFEANFSTTTNVSDYNIDVTKGAWVVKDDYLASRSLIENEFFIISQELEAPVSFYNISNIEDKFKIYVYSRESGIEWFDVSRSITGFEFDFHNDIITATKHYGSATEEVIDSFNFDFNTDNYLIELNCSFEGGWWYIFDDDLICELIIDDVLIKTVDFDNLVAEGEIHYTGMYTEQWDFRVNYISTIETYLEQDLWDLLDYLDIIVTIVFFVPPEIIMPFWLNFVFFKMPLVAAMWIGIEMLRGVS